MGRRPGPPISSDRAFRASRSGLRVGLLYASLVLLTAATFGNVSRLVGATKWVEHTKNVLSELSTTLDIVTAAESTEREFVITGDPRYRLRAGVEADLEAHLANLGRLVADNPMHRQSAAELRGAALARLARLRVLEDVRTRSGLRAAIPLAADSPPDRVREITAVMENRERSLLARRRAETEGVARFTVATLAVGGFLMLFLIGSFHRGLAERDRNERRLAEARRAAEEANARKDRFLASVSHELRTPLTPVLAGVRLLEREDLPVGASETLAMIRRNVERESRLVEDLLDLARVAKGKLDLRMGTVDLHEVVRDAVETCRSELEAKRLSVRVELAAEGHSVRGDAARLEQVFWNLLRNAIKFTPPGGAISVRTADEKGGRVSVSVSDTGMGIARDDLGRIFDPFEQGARAEVHGGLGLGLAIAREMTERHGGTIAAASDGQGRGATFEVALPAISGASEGEAAARPADAARIRILVVEDHADTARAIAALLRADGHEVVIAGTVAEAVAAHRERPADLVLSDLGLPDGSGLRLPSALDAIRPTRAIVLSGYGSQADLNRSREAGFVGHLVKPVTAEKIAGAVALAFPPGAGRTAEPTRLA